MLIFQKFQFQFSKTTSTRTNYYTFINIIKEDMNGRGIVVPLEKKETFTSHFYISPYVLDSIPLEIGASLP
jgi:hypothetical protein